jgi:hypothetical protein
MTAAVPARERRRSDEEARGKQRERSHHQLVFPGHRVHLMAQ